MNMTHPGRRVRRAGISDLSQGQHDKPNAEKGFRVWDFRFVVEGSKIPMKVMHGNALQTLGPNVVAIICRLGSLYSPVITPVFISLSILFAI